MSGTIATGATGATIATSAPVAAPLGTPRVEVSAGRATPKGPAFSRYVSAATPVLRGAEAVASVLPGGPVVAAAVHAPQSLASGSLSSSPTGVGAPLVPRTGAGSVASVAGATPTVGDGSGVESVLADSQAFNLYYLQLQEQMSAENRQFSTISNVLKARHDTVKNAIGNIR